jgi:broad specificity phosphatase PhoE
MRHLVVRHGQAGRRGSTGGDDLLRVLTDDGKAEAHALVAQHSSSNSTAVWSSRAVRCVETVAPLAAALGLEVRITPHLLAEADPAQLLGWLLALDSPVVVCSHGELIGGLMALLDQQGLPLDAAATWPKGSTWELQIDHASVTHARFMPPPAV